LQSDHKQPGGSAKPVPSTGWVPGPLYKIFGGKTIGLLRKELSGCEYVLDLGCGYNSPVQYLDVRYSLGVELFEPYLNESRSKSLHSEYRQADIREVSFEDDSFDAVILLEVLEHLDKDEGLKLIANMRRWARKKVIITVPNGFVWQDGYDDNELQEHKANWTVQELRELGFRVYGLGGIKQLHGYKGNLKYKPQILWKAVSFLSMPLLYYMPENAFLLGAAGGKEKKA
jgi:SAM-dependent methyltransferase